MYEKVKNAGILKKLKKYPELFNAFKPEPRASKEFDFNDDGERFTVIYKSINGTVFSSHDYRISDYNKTWGFWDDEKEEPESSKLKDNLFEHFARDLRKISDEAVDNRLKAYNESINNCFNDVIKDLSFRVEDAAKKGSYSVSSEINIYIGKYLDDQDIDKLTIKQRDDWSRIVTKKLDEYFEAKGFNTDHVLQSNYYTLDWSYNETECKFEPETLTDTYKGKKKVTTILPDIEGSHSTTGGKKYDSITINRNSSNNKSISDTKSINLQANDKDCIIGDINPLSKGLYSNIKCPHCGARHFMEKYSISDCVYRPTIYKDGEVISPIKGEGMTTTFECLECGKEFTI